MRKVIFIIIYSLIILTYGYSKDFKYAVYTEGKYIYLDATLLKNFPEEFKEYLYDGIEITIQYELKLKEKTPFYILLDKTIKEIIITRKLYYNIWSKKYIVKERGKKLCFSTWKETEKYIKKLKKVKICHIRKKRKRYILLKCYVVSLKLFPPFSWIIDIATKVRFETKWVKIQLK